MTSREQALFYEMRTTDIYLRRFAKRFLQDRVQESFLTAPLTFQLWSCSRVLGLLGNEHLTVNVAECMAYECRVFLRGCWQDMHDEFGETVDILSAHQLVRRFGNHAIITRPEAIPMPLRNCRDRVVLLFESVYTLAGELCKIS